MVRASEIGCRNGWDSDFWVPAGSAELEEDGVVGSISAASNRGSDEMTSFAPFRFDPAPTSAETEYAAEDRVVEVSASARTPQAEKPRQASDCIQDPKEALRLARQQFQSKRKQTGRIADISAGKPILGSDPDFAEDRLVSTSPQMVEHVPPTPEPPIYRVPPVSRNEIERTFPTITSFAEDVDRFESVPATDSPRSGVRSQPHTEQTSVEAPPVFVDDFDGNYWESQASPGVKRRESRVDRWWRRRREQRITWAAESDYAAEAGERGDDLFGPLPEQNANADRLITHETERAIPVSEPRPLGPRPAAPARASSNNVDQRQPVAPPRQEVDDWNDEPVSRWVDDGFLAEQPLDMALPQVRREPRTAQVTMDDLPEWSSPAQSGYRTSSESESFSQGPAIAPDIPRVCRTCRDFKPTGTGERGWCNNNHAFSHRRMVEADELACGSSYWCWWLPHDGIWQKDFDASRHAMPTPRVDRMLAATHQYARGEQVSGDEIRRQG